MKDNQNATMNGENSSSLVGRVIKFLEERRNRILRGEINCIPLPFNRFKSEMPGIEQGSYYLISGGTKAGKSQLANYLFVYNTILYSYYNPEEVKPKIFYYNLEETPEAITLRFMSYLLNSLFNIIVSPTELKSTDKDKPLSQEVLEMLNKKEFLDIMNYYEQCISFRSSKNPTGCWKEVKAYADANGITTYDTIKIKDDLGLENTVKKFKYYTPNNPNEYVFIIVDHISLAENERGLDLRQTINKWSEYMIIFRNRYNYIPVVIQQQNLETVGLEAFKQNKIRPTMAGLADSKATGKDCTVMIGITNPYSYELPNYLGYDVQKFKDHFRVMEIVLNRNGRSNGICPLFFDGAINSFKELPLPNDVININKVYSYLETRKKSTTFFISKINNSLQRTKNHNIFAKVFNKIKIKLNGITNKTKRSSEL